MPAINSVTRQKWYLSAISAYVSRDRRFVWIYQNQLNRIAIKTNNIAIASVIDIAKPKFFHTDIPDRDRHNEPTVKRKWFTRAFLNNCYHLLSSSIDWDPTNQLLSNLIILHRLKRNKITPLKVNILKDSAQYIKDAIHNLNTFRTLNVSDFDLAYIMELCTQYTATATIYIYYKKH